MEDSELEEKQAFVKEFVTESRELLDTIEPQIIALEENQTACEDIDQEVLNSIFRLFHTMKGTASFFDLQTIIDITHEAETLLDIFRKGKATVRPQHVDLLCRTSDFIRNILDTVECQLSDQGFENDAQNLIIDYKQNIACIQGESGSEIKPAAVEPENPTCFEEPNHNQVRHEYQPPVNLDDMGLLITGDMTKRFIEEAQEFCDRAEAALLSLENRPGDEENISQAFRAFHNLKGNAGFFAYGNLEKMSHLAESILDQIRAGARNCDPEIISSLLLVVDVSRIEIERSTGGSYVETNEILKTLEMLNRLLLAPPSAQELNPETKKTAHKTPEILETAIGDDEANLVEKVAVLASNLEAPPKASEKRPATPVGTDRQPSPVQQTIRVDIAKLDQLLDLVGELVISESMVVNAQNSPGKQMDILAKNILQLDKITREVQEVAMSMRMISLAGTFRKMRRLVHDLAHKMDKNVHLEIIGEETEVDKTIIEQIADPLVHLIRNAVDHGIESTEQRIASGKSETGQVIIEARHATGEVWILVSDDGGGLNKEKILQKALQKGLVNPGSQDMKDEDIYQLIFEPGFSTAETVSTVSGRGVGMDVVKQSISKLGGKVDIHSKVGIGTTFAIRIPLTLAIIEGMVVEVGQSRYTIPIGSVKESFQPRPEQITLTPDGLEIVRIRGELEPVIHLHEVYQKQSSHIPLNQGILIAVENGNKKCCLFVDKLIGQQQIVIKGLPANLGRVRGVSGCAILGDGDISMILDIADLIDSVEEVAV